MNVEEGEVYFVDSDGSLKKLEEYVFENIPSGSECCDNSDEDDADVDPQFNDNLLII